MSEQSGGLEGREGIQQLRGLGVVRATSIRVMWQGGESTTSRTSHEGVITLRFDVKVVPHG